MQRTIERLRSKMGKTNRMLVAGVLAFGLLLGLFTVLLSLDVVTIVDSNGQSHTLITTSRNANEILAMAGVETGKNDEVIYTDNGVDGAHIRINRSFIVSVMADGETYRTETLGGTVADALKACMMSLGEHDFVEPSMDAELYRGMTVNVRRVEFFEETKRIEVAPEDVEAFKAALQATEDPVSFIESKSRIYDATMRNRVVDGQVVDSEIIALSAIYHPYDAPSEKFEPGVPVSTIDAFLNVELDGNGVPVNYQRLMTNAVCTAYSSSGGRGAGGQGLYCGTVAVNPNIIPYGTRLYIAAADGSFVYGYAIASDTGTAMMDGYVDIDLYFESNAECNKFGKRLLNVYILG